MNIVVVAHFENYHRLSFRLQYAIGSALQSGYFSYIQTLLQIILIWALQTFKSTWLQKQLWGLVGEKFYRKGFEVRNEMGVHVQIADPEIV